MTELSEEEETSQIATNAHQILIEKVIEAKLRPRHWTVQEDLSVSPLETERF